jgi:type I restriction enzyme R subunit
MTSIAAKERAFEVSIEKHLVEHGWLKAAPKGFDRQQLLHTEELLSFIEATQPDDLAKLAVTAGGEEAARDSLVKRLVQELDSHGTLHVLRRGFKDRGVHFQAAFFKPAHNLTPELVARYEANRCTIVRQLIYSDKTSNELDLALFINGLLVATAELKNALTGQDVEDAKKQYRTDRDPKDKALSGRALVHFAVDPDLVFVTTKLAGTDTVFLPFNRGDENGGAGNPPHPSGHATAYLWEDVWQRDAWLEIYQRFLHYEDSGSKSRPDRLLFPRYHQWDAVRTLRELARGDGPGNSYLVQHSAGSGKSNTIGWLAHQLASLYAGEQKVFDKIVVITDRRVLDKQLRDTVFQFDHTPGVVHRVEKHSGQLADALASPGAQIIITTLQKFPFVINQVADLEKANYAIVVDEAHSSQTGETAKDLKAALGRTATEAQELEAAEKGDSVSQTDAEDFVAKSVADRGRQPNLSYFAFTATPKQKTLQMFGSLNDEGDLIPAHVYSMRQAIEERFILDVLRNYTTYKTYWRLAKEVSDDPDVDRAKAARALARFVSLHPYNLAQKAEVIVEHFRRSTRHKIDGRAKAIVVTRSRLHAVRYKQAVDRYIGDKGYADLKTLVAFSGKVIDENKLTYTEVEMNGGLAESRLPETFESDDYQLLIVAEKYQTGYDQPLLHTMYVDKKLEGVKAVQTLSRLNRALVGKDDTFILDFANDAESVQKAFAPFYDTTIAEPTDVNAVYDAQGEVESYAVVSDEEMAEFVAALAKYSGDESKNGLLYKLLDPARKRYLALPDQTQEQFRSSLDSFLRLYAFLAQCVPFADSALERLYLYGRFLATRMPRDHEPGLDISSDVVLTHLRTEAQTTADISLAAGEGTLKGFTGETVRSDPQMAPLSEIIEILNDRFGTEFTGADRLYFQQLVEATVEDKELMQQARVNDLENWKYAFKRKFNSIVVDRRGANEELFEKFLADPDFAETITDWVMRQSYQQFRQPGEGVQPPAFD